MTVEIPASVREFWKAFEAAAGAGRSQRFCEAFHFDDNEPSANELAALVLAGTKRATASLLWSYEGTNRERPKPLDLSVVTNWSGRPICVIETIAVDVVPYEDVSEEFAATEGEGDGSLAYWQRAHWAYFGRECARIGRTPSLDMPVACERFELIYPRAA